jgi:hypothetical protein
LSPGITFLLSPQKLKLLGKIKRNKIITWHPLRNSEFQTPLENLVNRRVWILNGMALCRGGAPP